MDLVYSRLSSRIHLPARHIWFSWANVFMWLESNTVVASRVKAWIKSHQIGNGRRKSNCNWHHISYEFFVSKSLFLYRFSSMKTHWTWWFPVWVCIGSTIFPVALSEYWTVSNQTVFSLLRFSVAKLCMSCGRRFSWPNLNAKVDYRRTFHHSPKSETLAPY